MIDKKTITDCKDIVAKLKYNKNTQLDGWDVFAIAELISQAEITNNTIEHTRKELSDLAIILGKTKAIIYTSVNENFSKSFCLSLINKIGARLNRLG